MYYHVNKYLIIRDAMFLRDYTFVNKMILL